MTTAAARIGGSARGFFRWWAGELLGTLPADLRSGLNGGRRRLVLTVKEREILFARRNNGATEPQGRIAADGQGAGAVQARLARALEEARIGPGNAVVCLDRTSVLRRSVSLPAAAAENLSEVLAFEMDRFSPFTASQVYYDFRIAGTDTELKQIRVNLVMIPRHDAEQALSLARAVGLEPTRLTFAGDETNDAGFDLMPRAATKRPGAGWRMLTAALAVALAGLVAANLYVPLQQKQGALAAAEARLSEARSDAAQAERLKARVQGMVKQAAYVTERRRRAPTGTELMEEIAELLPDNTWLTKLQVSKGMLVLGGFSEKPSALVATLEDSPLLGEIRFVGALSSDPRFDGQRFSLSARILPRGE